MELTDSLLPQKGNTQQWHESTHEQTVHDKLQHIRQLRN